MKKLAIFVAAAAFTAFAKDVTIVAVHWTWCGWGGGGWFWSSAADPVNPDVFYMGGDVNGIWKTVDAGKSWSFVNKGLGNYVVYSLAVAPSRPQTVYALTENGVCASFNGAASWNVCRETVRSAYNVCAKRGGSVHAIAVDPKDDRTVYAGGGNGRVAKSQDGGATWKILDYISSRLPEPGERPDPFSGAGYGVVTVAANEMDWSNYIRIQKFLSQEGEDWSRFATVSACLFIPASAPKGLAATIVLQSGGWVWKEGGMVPLEPGAWTELSFPMSTYHNPKQVNMIHLVVRTNGKGYKGEIAVDHLVASGSGGERTIGEWNGPDAEGWIVSPDANTKSITRSFAASRQPRIPTADGPIRTIAISGADPRIVLICQEKYGLFRSTDAGRSWRHVREAPKGATCVAWAGPLAPKRWYGAFGRSGVFVSEDDGVTWRSLGLELDGRLGARDVAPNPKSPGTVHVIVSEGFNGYVATTRDNGKTWEKRTRFTAERPANPTLPGNGGTGTMSGLANLTISPADPDRLHLPGNWNPCFSTDGGKTWQERCRGADITCFNDVRFLDGKVYAAAMDEGTLASEDGGKKWQVLFPVRWQAGLSGHHWRVLPQRLKNGATRIVCTVSPWAHGHDFPVKVIVSEDGGKTFTESAGLPEYRTHANTMWGEGHGRALAADPKRPDTMYLGIDGDPENGKAGGGIFKSVDGGRTFVRLANQPKSLRMFYGLAVDPTDSRRIVWGACGENAGVYISEDGGESWRKTQGLNDWIFNVEVAPSGTIYAGGSCLWRSDDSGRHFRAMGKLPSGTVIGIAVDPDNESRLWCSVTTWNGDAEGGVFESLDGGRTWRAITGDIPYRKPLVLRYNREKRELWAAGPAVFKTPRP